MTSRARRLLAAAAALVLLLFVGRGLVTFLADRWWASAISPEALDAVRRWHLLGVLLDAGAVVVASAWFAGHALLVARAIGSVQVERRIGELRVREAIPVRLLLFGAVGTGLLLGILTGVGARAWRAPVALAWQGVHYGVDDPLLGVDLGVLVARYPVWRLAHQFGLLLVVLGLAFSALLYLGIGAFRRREGRLALHPDARRHLGALLGGLGLMIAIGYLLTPYRLATAIDVPLAPVAATTRILAANAAAGAAIAVGIISLAWAFRSRSSLLGASWAVMALAAVTERLVVPAFVAEASAEDDRGSRAREMDQRFYGITMAGSVASSDTTPAVTVTWDPGSLAGWAASRGGTFLVATPVGVAGQARWLVATHFPGDPGSLEVALVEAGTLAANGLPVLVGGDTSHRPLRRDPRSVPGSTSWRTVSGRGGVAAGGAWRRAAMAWALQAPGLLRLTPDQAVDWDLDPRDRLTRLVPALEWRLTGIAEHAGRLVWLVNGFALVERAPLATRVRVGERQVAGMVPAIVATVHADDASTSLYLDPAADSLGHAWARVVGSLVRGSAEMPEWLRTALPYPEPWLEVQLDVMSRGHWDHGARPTDAESGRADPPAAVWDVGGPRLQTRFEYPGSQVPSVLVEAGRRGGVAGITLTNLAELELPSARERTRAWRRELAFAQLRDSVRAAGDTLLSGPQRHHLGAAGPVSWQVFHSAGRRGPPAVVWVATAKGPTVAGGRLPETAWATLLGDRERDPEGVPLDVVTRFEAVRSWISRADSALARGDLTAFARAWEAVRGLLLEPPRE